MEKVTITSQEARHIERQKRYFSHPDNLENQSEFTKSLTDQSVVDGDRVELQTFWRAKPLPEVTWYFNGEIIQDSPDFKVIDSSQFLQLIIDM